MILSICLAQVLASFGLQGFDTKSITTCPGVWIGGYFEFSKTYYPKAIAYFDALKQKYPALQNRDIVILDGPMADWDTIYFPLKWIEELEKGNKFYLDATEWIILHELGHVVNRDVYKKLISMAGMYGGYELLKSGDNLKKSIYQIRQTQQISHTNDAFLNNTANGQIKVGFWLMAAGTIGFIYGLATIEYGADDYAMKHCDNEDAWLAAYEYLDRYAPNGWLPGILHSFKNYRLSRIAKAFEKKFGKPLVVVPQSLQPEYVA